MELSMDLLATSLLHMWRKSMSGCDFFFSFGLMGYISSSFVLIFMNHLSSMAPHEVVEQAYLLQQHQSEG